MTIKKGKPKAAALVFCLAVLLTIGLSPSALAIGDDLMGGIKLTDPELDKIRGGYGGFYLGVYWSLFIDTLGDQASDFAVSSNLPEPGEPVIIDPQFQVNGNGVAITTGVGNMNGASGIFHIVQASGDNMIIHSNLIVQITLINAAKSSMPKFKGFTPW
jgi:hypothetical protein